MCASACCSVIKSQSLSYRATDGAVSQRLNHSRQQSRRLYHRLVQMWLSPLHWQSSLEQRVSEWPTDWSRSAPPHAVCCPAVPLSSVSITPLLPSSLVLWFLVILKSFPGCQAVLRFVYTKGVKIDCIELADQMQVDYGSSWMMTQIIYGQH